MSFVIGSLLFVGGVFFGVVTMCVVQTAGRDET